MRTARANKSLFMAALIAIAAMAVGGCGGGGGAASPGAKGANATISGKVRIEGQQNCSGVVVVAEKVTDGVTRTVARMLESAKEGRVADSRTAAEAEGVYMTSSGTDCTYRMSVAPDTYSVSAYKEDATGAQPQKVTARSAADVVIDFELVATGKISGVAVLGARTTDVVLVFVDTTSFAAYAGSDGSYTISNIPIGTYTLKFSRNGIIYSTREGITVTAGATTNNELTNVHFECDEGGGGRMDCYDPLDKTPPYIVGVRPNADSEPVSDFSPIIYLEFNEPMKSAAAPSNVIVNIRDLTTTGSATSTYSAATSWPQNGFQLSVRVPQFTLSKSTNYVLEVVVDPYEIKDAAGNILALRAGVPGAHINPTTATIMTKFSTVILACDYMEGFVFTSTVLNTVGNLNENIPVISYDTSGTSCVYTAVAPVVAATFSTTAPTTTSSGFTAGTIAYKDATFVKKFSGGSDIAASGATYVGSAVCAGCHSAIKTSFDQTNHATALSRKVSLTNFTASCLPCHTVNGPIVPAYATGATFGSPDTRVVSSPAAGSGAFGLNPTDYSGYTASQTVTLASSNNGIQCENCHGPGSLHVAGDGNTDLIVRGSEAASASTCAVCHDAPTRHTKPLEWAMSMHSSTTRTGLTCNPCHSGDGFLAFMKRTGLKSRRDQRSLTTPETMKINCATCHDPHDATQPYQTRLPKNELCIQCHSNIYGNGMRVRGPYKNGTPHDNHQGDHIAGIGLINPQGKMLWTAAGMTLCQPAEIVSQTVTPAPTPNYNYGIFTTAPTVDCGSDYMSRDYVQTIKTPIAPSMGDTTCADCHMYNGNHNMKPSEEACSSCHPGMNVSKTIGKAQSEYLHRYSLLRKRFQIMKNDLGIATKPPAATAVIQPPTKGANFDSSSAAIQAYYNINWNFSLLNNDMSKGFHNPKQVKLGFEYIDQMLKDNGY